MATTDILNNYYFLSDHPFNPKTDQKANLDLKESNLSLLRELKIFEHEKLRNYFVKVGPFLAASNALEGFLDKIGYDGSTRAPAILVQGPQGSGIDSMTQYAARAIRDRASGAKLRPAPIPSASQARFLLLVKGELETFLHDDKGIFAKYKDLINPQRPDQAFLTALIAELLTLDIPNQPLILTVGLPSTPGKPLGVTWDCKDWLLWLYQLLSPLNVFLIFVSDDSRIASWFDNHVGNSLITGLSLRIKGLDADEGQTFVNERLGHFRSQSVTPDSFPFNPAAFPNIFGGVPDKRVGVKFFIQILHNSLNGKISKLDKSYVTPAPPREEIQIDWPDMSDAYEFVLKPKERTS